MTLGSYPPSESIQIRVQVRFHGDFPVLEILSREVMGEDAARSLKREIDNIIQQGHRYMIVDLSHIVYMDSAGLSALLHGHRKCRDAGGMFVVTGAHNWVERIIRISELHRVLHLMENVQQGVEYLLLSKLQNEIQDHDADSSPEEDAENL